MKLPLQMQIPELLQQIRSVEIVHIRLALSTDNSNDWIARSLVIDVFPDRWLDTVDDLQNDYSPPVWPHPYKQAFFLAGFVSYETLASWFLHPEECALPSLDRGVGQPNITEHFCLPELQESSNGNRINSRQPDGFALIPWPHFTHQFRPKDWNIYHANDNEPLFIPGQRHFDNFQEARAFWIHDITDPQRIYSVQDTVAFRVIDGDGWIQRIELAPAKTRFDVAIGGFRVYPGEVILKGSNLYEMRSIMGPGNVTFERETPYPSQVSFILGNNDGELDRRWYVSDSSPLIPYTLADSDRLLEISGTEDESSEVLPNVVEHRVPRAKGNDDRLAVNLRNQLDQKGDVPNRVQVLRVVVASPNDVQKERDTLPRVLDGLNKGIAKPLGLRFELWRWETDTYPGFHANGPQGQIDQNMSVETADIVIGIFWKRFGTPVSDARSGTEHELLKAINAWKLNGHPHVMVYFNQQALMPKNSSEAAQLQSVLEFKNQLSEQGLYADYKGSRQFEALVRQHLEQFLLNRDN